MVLSYALPVLILTIPSLGQCQENITSDDIASERFGFFNPFHPYSRVECTNSLSEAGFCVPLRHCENLLVQVRHLNPGRVFQYLKDYTFSCVIRGQVCCPSVRHQDFHLSVPTTSATKEQPIWSWPNAETTTNLPVRTTTKTLVTHKSSSPSTKHPKKTNKGTTHPPSEGVKTRHKNRKLLPEDACGVDLGVRVLGGEETALEEHPWLALLRMKLPNGRFAFICGGSLITTKYVLTAAHCIKGVGIPSGGVLDMVRVGEHNVNKALDCYPGGQCNAPPQDIEVETRIVHPNFTPEDPGTFNDIALLRLKEDVKFNLNVQPVCLPLDNISIARYDGKKLTTVGWGRTSNGAKFNSPTKQKVNVPVVPFSVCAPQYKARQINLRETQMCAGGEVGKDSCQGDSGGPLLSQHVVDSELRWFIQGVVSTGPKECGKAGSPAIYTRVSKYLNWILDNLHE